MSEQEAAKEVVAICREVIALEQRLIAAARSVAMVGLKGLQSELGRAAGQAEYLRPRAEAKAKS